MLNIEQSTDKSAKPVPTPFGFCIYIHKLLNIVTNNQFESITRLKFQLEGGQQFLKMSVNIVSEIAKCHYKPNPNSVLTNFVIVIKQAPETYNNLREMFNYPSILTLFEIGIFVILRLQHFLVEFNKHRANTLVHIASGEKEINVPEYLPKLDLIMAKHLT